MTETADLYVSCLRPLCFTFAASMFHAYGLYVSCLRSLSTTHGYDKGRIAFWGARKQLGALAVLCGFNRRACKHRGCEAGLKHWGWVCAFWLVLFGRFFSWFVLLGSFFLVVLFVVRSSVRAFRSFFSWFVLGVRSFGRSFRGSFFGFVLLVVLFVVRAFGFVLLVVLFVVRALGSCFLVVLFVVRALGSCFWSFFSWFVLLVVLLVVLFVVRSFGRSFCGSCFWGLVCVFCSML